MAWLLGTSLDDTRSLLYAPCTRLVTKQTVGETQSCLKELLYFSLCSCSVLHEEHLMSHVTRRLVLTSLPTPNPLSWRIQDRSSKTKKLLLIFVRKVVHYGFILIWRLTSISPPHPDPADHLFSKTQVSTHCDSCLLHIFLFQSEG